MVDKVKVGFIGTGNIFANYVKNSRMYDILDVVTCADLDMNKASAAAAEHGLPGACSVEDLLADPTIEIIVNLTIPAVHAEVSLRALGAGKHVYSEKPLGLTTAQGREIMDTARQHGLLVGCAPDTFLGGGQQTCRKLIDDGAIGQPVAATAFMVGHGPESWHPNPDFYYQVGGGPMFDMGPYYLTALINLFGPARRITGSARMSFSERTATSQKHYGRKLKVEIPTHVAGVIDFENGVVATIITSFDVWSHRLPIIEVYGSDGSLAVPDPNTFGGAIRMRRADEADWSEMPHTHPTEIGRGTGIADMAYAIRTGRPHRASGELAYHVLELMEGIHIASETGSHYTLQSHPAQPEAVPSGLAVGVLD